MNPADTIRVKELLPTSLGSAEIRDRLAAEILRRSFFSARMEYARYLAAAREACARLAAGEWDPATARHRLGAILEGMGMLPSDGGGISNPASAARLNLILETNARMAASRARLDAQTPSALAARPAWELRRAAERRAKRADWPSRWRAAAEACGWEGVARGTPRMAALKGSPVWDRLGEGAGGFRDTLRNPYPPFAYGSGLDWFELAAAEAAALGLDPAAAKSAAAKSLSPDPEELRRAAAAAGLSASDLDALQEEYA